MIDVITSFGCAKLLITAANNTSLESLNLYLQADTLIIVLEEVDFDKCVIKVVA